MVQGRGQRAQRRTKTPVRGRSTIIRSRRGADSLAILLLLACLAAILVYAAAQPPTAFSFTADRPNPPALLRNFYGNERNATGAYRWSKPEAVISATLDAPATYQITLRLAAGTDTQGPLHLYLNGTQVATFTLSTTPQDYVIERTISPLRWAQAGGDELTIEWSVTPFMPPGDPRALGVILYSIAVAPVGATWPSALPLVAPNLLLLLLAYAALRLAGLATRTTSLILTAVVAGIGIAALYDRGIVLFWSYQAATHPDGAAIAVGALALFPASLRAGAGTPTNALDHADASPNFWRRASWPVLPLLALGGGLRLYHFDRTSLWFDEGATIFFAKQSWVRVLGLQGAYDFHPPLYYSLVKAVTIILPPQHAGRLLSVALGTLTIALVYTLTVRLLGRQAAVFAALTLAISPPHLWFSQEARMYAPSVLLVGLSYLAIVAFTQASSPAARWGLAALYAVSVALALYFVYSSLYGLLPQLLIFAYLLAGRDWAARLRRLLPLFAGGLLALLAYLPWLPQIISSVNYVGNRSGMLGPTPERVQETLLALVGPGNVGMVGGSYYLGLWGTQPAWRAAMILCIMPLMVFGLIGAIKRSALATIVTLALLVGTIVATILVSLYSPGYAARTILAASLGWALLVGASATLTQPRWLRLLQRASFACLLLLSLGTIQTMQTTAYRQHYRETVAGTLHVASTGYPIIPVGYLTAFFDAYAPDLRYEERASFASRLRTPTAPDAFWLVYGADHTWEGLPTLWRQLDSLGYRQMLHQHFGDNLYLDLIATPRATFGTPLPLPVGFPLAPTIAPGWQLAGGQLTTSGTGGSIEVSPTGTQPRLWYDHIAPTGGLYVATVEAADRTILDRRLATVACLDVTGQTLAISTPGRIPVEPPLALTPGAWRTITLAVVCPSQTTIVRLTLEGQGAGEVRFRNPTLALIPLPTTATAER